MLKYLIGGVVGFSAAIGLMFATNASSSDDILTMADGSYTAYHIQKMFDTETGEPVYWVFAGKGRYDRLVETNPETEVYIEPQVQGTKMFIIPRNKLTGVPDTVLGYPDVYSLRIKIAQGVGQVIN